MGILLRTRAVRAVHVHSRCELRQKDKKHENSGYVGQAVLVACCITDAVSWAPRGNYQPHTLCRCPPPFTMAGCTRPATVNKHGGSRAITYQKSAPVRSLPFLLSLLVQSCHGCLMSASGGRNEKGANRTNTKLNDGEYGQRGVRRDGWWLTRHVPDGAFAATDAGRLSRLCLLGTSSLAQRQRGTTTQAYTRYGGNCAGEADVGYGGGRGVGAVRGTCATTPRGRYLCGRTRRTGQARRGGGAADQRTVPLQTTAGGWVGARAHVWGAPIQLAVRPVDRLDGARVAATMAPERDSRPRPPGASDSVPSPFPFPFPCRCS